jgi:signal transduction histidine kinase
MPALRARGRVENVMADQPGTVLYVDDDRANLTVFEAACAREFDVLTTSSGVEALEVMHRREIAVLLADQRMPAMSGTELLEHARQAFPQTMRILVTAYSDLSAAIGAVNRGQIHHYISKPWDPEAVRAVLRESLETYDTKRKVRVLEQRLLETERVYALGVVAAGIAHELRNPVSVLQTNLDMARFRLASSSAPQVSEADAGAKILHHLEMAQHAVAQMREVIAGIELANRRRDDERSADLAEVARLAARCVRSELSRRAVFETSIDAVPPVAGSPNRLGQVVMNLLINAFEALPDRPRAENRVSLGLARDGDHLVLRIEDNGVGIPKETAARIFDPFFTTKSQGGTGLGLAITRQIVEESGGRISVESEPGRGTRFAVRLPIAAGGPADGDDSPGAAG